MTSPVNSGVSTPFSSTATASVPSSPHLKVSPNTLEQDVYFNPHITASAVVEYVASRSDTTSTVYVYDLAEQAGFGTLTKEWATSRSDSAPVVGLQTRAGAGLSLVGRLSVGTSKDTVQGANLTVYTSPTGLSIMAPSLVHLPPSSPSSRLVIHVPNTTPLGGNFALSSSLAPLASAWSILPEGIVILFSSTPQQTSDFATLAHRLTQYHVIHIFDQYNSSRETGHRLAPLNNATAANNHTTPIKVLAEAGYKFFDVFGDFDAHTVVVLLNGPLARAIAARISGTTGLAVVVVNVLRPWDEKALSAALPATTQTIHVIDEVPNASTQGNLYIEVFGSVLGYTKNIPVHGHRFTPEITQEYLSGEDVLFRFLNKTAPIPLKNPPQSRSSVKNLLLLSTPQSPLSALPRIIENLFFSIKGISARALLNYDVLSKSGGVSAFKLVLSANALGNGSTGSPESSVDEISRGGADFLAVLDQSLILSHAALQHAKQHCVVLIVTAWSPEELISHLPHETISFILEHNLRVFTVNAQELSHTIVGGGGSLQDLIQNIVVHLAFIRLYLGSAATEAKVVNVVQSSLGKFARDISLERVSSAAWSGLREINFNHPLANSPDTGHSLKTFEFNAIAVETEGGDTVVNGTRLASWHDAAKHLLFPAAFAPEPEPVLEDYPPIPSLRPEVSERTFLVTCTVNRRLTPIEYDRNVFHVEFDTTGTGLKYAVGEALGVHGWNDEQEVLDFCAWYGVDPERLITIPVPGGDGTMHTRTILQALQQQIDLFGHPPKSFYTDLAPYAGSSVEKHALLFIGSPEGSTTYKKYSEKDTVTFVDILMKYPSARPGIERLCELVGDIKPRHYSIASAQSAVGNRVDLLVVTVDWKTPSGKIDSRGTVILSLPQ
jgi:sulfite reductase (NADPH) flavoprotein alpha-component